MTHVLISYLPDDSAYAEQIRNALTDFQVAHQSPPWSQSVDNAIGEAFAVVVVLTPASLASTDITYIWAFALGIGVSVVPVLFQPATLPRRLKVLRCLDFTTTESRNWHDLTALLKDIQTHYQPDAVRISQEMQTIVDPDESNKIKAQLLFHEGTDPDIYDMEQAVITLGRDMTNALVFNNPEISRHHVRFTYTIEGFTIEDLGSRNGTFINDQQLAGVQLLRNGDMIRLGDAITVRYGIKET